MNEEAKGLAAQLHALADEDAHAYDVLTKAAKMAEAWEARLRQVVAELRDWSSDRIKNEYEIAADMLEKALEQTP